MNLEDIVKKKDDMQALLDAGIINEDDAKEIRKALRAEALSRTKELIDGQLDHGAASSNTAPAPPVPTVKPAAPVQSPVPETPDTKAPDNKKADMIKCGLAVVAGILIYLLIRTLVLHY